MALGQLDFNYFLTRNCLTITFFILFHSWANRRLVFWIFARKSTASTFSKCRSRRANSSVIAWALVPGSPRLKSNGWLNESCAFPHELKHAAASFFSCSLSIWQFGRRNVAFLLNFGGCLKRIIQRHKANSRLRYASSCTRLPNAHERQVTTLVPLYSTGF